MSGQARRIVVEYAGNFPAWSHSPAMTCKHCEKCEETFEPKRSDQRFCSPKCQHQNWCDQNREKARELWRAAYHRNAETKKARVRKYVAENPERHKQWYKNCMETDRGRAIGRDKTRRYRALKLGALGFFSDSEFQALVAAFGSICLRCQRADVSLTADHVVPLSKGGAGDISNIQPLCGPCNSWKRDRFLDFRGSAVEPRVEARCNSERPPDEDQGVPSSERIKQWAA